MCGVCMCWVVYVQYACLIVYVDVYMYMGCTGLYLCTCLGDAHVCMCVMWGIYVVVCSVGVCTCM